MERHNDDFAVENCASVTVARNSSMLAQRIRTVNDAKDMSLLVSAVCVAVSVGVSFPLLLSSTRDTLVVPPSWPSNFLASVDSIIVMGSLRQALRESHKGSFTATYASESDPGHIPKVRSTACTQGIYCSALYSLLVYVMQKWAICCPDFLVAFLCTSGEQVLIFLAFKGGTCLDCGNSYAPMRLFFSCWAFHGTTITLHVPTQIMIMMQHYYMLRVVVHQRDTYNSNTELFHMKDALPCACNNAMAISLVHATMQYADRYTERDTHPLGFAYKNSRLPKVLILLWANNYWSCCNIFSKTRY